MTPSDSVQAHHLELALTQRELQRHQRRAAREGCEVVQAHQSAIRSCEFFLAVVVHKERENFLDSQNQRFRRESVLQTVSAKLLVRPRPGAEGEDPRILVLELRKRNQSTPGRQTCFFATIVRGGSLSVPPQTIVNITEDVVQPAAVQG